MSDHPLIPTHFTVTLYEVDGINADNVRGEETNVKVTHPGPPLPAILYLRLVVEEHIESSQIKSTELEVIFVAVKPVGC